ncbi:MAG: PfkB family carbohydrate kinase, partial [Lactococcus cremoris]
VLWDNQEKMIRTINDLAKRSQIILPGINEGEILTGSSEPEKIADFYLKQSPLTKTVVVKLGAEGAFAKLKSGESFTLSGFKVTKVIDTVGAGDGFAVGLESALLGGKTLKEAVKRACAVGALAVQSSGDSEGYPTKEELEAFYKEK